MIDIKDKTYKPNIEEIINFVNLPLFNELHQFMNSEYKALCKVEYSCDKVLLGWNIKYKKAGRTLCTVYPRKENFQLLLVVGNKEKQRTESALSTFCDEFQSIYQNTKEGMGQKWLLFDLTTQTIVYNDILKIIQIRREST